MTDHDLLARRLLLLKVLAERVAAKDKETRAELAADMKVGARDIADLPDGTKLGAVGYTKGRAGRPQITDERAFQEWVEKHHPEHVQVVRQVYASFRKLVLDHDGQLINVQTGEVEDVPGITWSEDGDPHLTVTAEKDAAAQVERAVRAGQLNLPDVLELGP